MTFSVGDQVKRGGWGSGFGGYEVTSPDSSYVTEQMGFSGIEDELDSFISMVNPVHSLFWRSQPPLQRTRDCER